MFDEVLCQCVCLVQEPVLCPGNGVFDPLTCNCECNVTEICDDIHRQEFSKFYCGCIQKIDIDEPIDRELDNVVEEALPPQHKPYVPYKPPPYNYVPNYQYIIQNPIQNPYPPISNPYPPILNPYRYPPVPNYDPYHAPVPVTNPYPNPVPNPYPQVLNPYPPFIQPTTNNENSNPPVAPVAPAVYPSTQQLPPQCPPDAAQQCRGLYELDPSTCQCHCPVTAQRYCTQHQLLDANTCSCTCLAATYRSCGNNRIIDQNTCECVCREPLDYKCANPLRHYNSQSCRCECTNVYIFSANINREEQNPFHEHQVMLQQQQGSRRPHRISSSSHSGRRRGRYIEDVQEKLAAELNKQDKLLTRQRRRGRGRSNLRSRSGSRSKSGNFATNRIEGVSQYNRVLVPGPCPAGQYANQQCLCY